MGPQQGSVDSPHSPQLGVISSPSLSRRPDLEEVTSHELRSAPINLYISEAGDYNHSVSGQCSANQRPPLAPSDQSEARNFQLIFPQSERGEEEPSNIRSRPSVMLNTCLLFAQVSILSI